LLIGPDGERWIAVGELIGAHGVRGEARLRPFNPDSSVIADVSEVALVPARGPWESKRIERARPHGPRWLVLLDGVATPEAARSLAGRRVAVRERDLPALAAGQFYCYELIGLDVVDDSGESVGTVSDVLSSGGNDLLVITAGERERLVPMVDSMVTAVDLDRRRIVVRPVPGLLD
jgi:16S rRNA processing protein RimM